MKITRILRYVTADKIIKWGLGGSLLLLVSQLVSIIIFYSSLPPFLPLYNQMSWGESRLGTRNEIFIPVAITFIFFLLNFSLLNRFYETMPLISRMLGITTLLITVLSFIFIIRTLQLVL